MNTIGKYRCRNCKQPLMVMLPQALLRGYLGCVLAVVGAYFILEWVGVTKVFMGTAALTLLLVISSFLFRYTFGYLDSAGR